MLRSIGPLAKNRWYAFAVVMTKDSASLFLQSEKDKPYTLEQSVPVEGAMAQSMGTWVIGRGFWAGKLDNPFCGWVDEIRISDEALPKESSFCQALGKGPSACEIRHACINGHSFHGSAMDRLGGSHEHR